jgi:hypothetical protein
MQDVAVLLGLLDKDFYQASLLRPLEEGLHLLHCCLRLGTHPEALPVQVSSKWA